MYRVLDDILPVLLLAVDKREASVVYASAEKRVRQPPTVSEALPRKPVRIAPSGRLKK